MVYTYDPAKALVLDMLDLRFEVLENGASINVTSWDIMIKLYGFVKTAEFLPGNPHLFHGKTWETPCFAICFYNFYVEAPDRKQRNIRFPSFAK